MSFLVSIEGFDGVGKTTQAKLLHNNLTKRSIKSLIVREPGGTTLAEKIREELNQNPSLTSTTELLLFEVARSDLVENVMMPNLSDGIIVVTDRYIDSTLAYQGFGRGLNLSKVKQLNNISSLGLLPEITFLLDMNVEDALRRVSNRNEDPEEKQITKFEKETVEFHQRVRNGFLEIAKNNKAHIHLADQFKNHTISRKYKAIVWGSPQDQMIEGYIERHKVNRKKMSLNKNAKGKFSKTLITLKKTYKISSLIECELKTGRTHQVRLHMTSINYPIVGDKVYGKSKINQFGKNKDSFNQFLILKNFNRHALHAYHLGFQHPKSNKYIEFNSELPLDMKNLLDLLVKY